MANEVTREERNASMRQRRADGALLREIAAEFGVHEGSVSHIIGCRDERGIVLNPSQASSYRRSVAFPTTTELREQHVRWWMRTHGQ
jgi:transposase